MDETEHLIEDITRAQRQLSRLIFSDRSSPLLETTLTIQQLKLLTLVRLHGSLSGHQLSDLLGVSMPTVSGLVDRMVERDLFRREDDPADRRVRRVVLSDEGNRLAAEFENAGQQLNREILAAIGLPALRDLASGLSAVVDVAERRLADGGSVGALAPDAGGRG